MKRITLLLFALCLCSCCLKAQKTSYIYPIKDINIKYEKGLNVKVINKVLVQEEEMSSKVLFEYYYSKNADPLTFISVFAAGDPNGIFVINKKIDFNDLRKQILNNYCPESCILNELDPLNITLRKDGLFVRTSYNTSINTVIKYVLAGDKYKECVQDFHFIGKKTKSMDPFEIYKSKDLKVSIGKIAVSEEFEIILCDYKAFAVGGVFLIKTKDDVLGWMKINIRQGNFDNKPNLEGVETYTW